MVKTTPKANHKAPIIFRLPLSKQRQPENHPQHKKHFRLPYGTNPKAA
ncbi:hypothetical protein [Kingella oralis]|uniref:Uncharacterized protein n=1 Tax=Kingella oralis ATCC 51147 TaxID=629741 RepID=C4GFI4_9NEIS|nr:hypothetical protein [Kingella oralis]EEP68990.1 hypothetical protein GCWU000324_00901 [Kingella oralis ATCC 51147]QMT41860.1 hypothetical protein H3L93_07320 [Kingella oralis]